MISATSGSVTGSASLTVTPAAVIALNITPATLSMGLGSSRQLQAIATLSDGTTQDLTGIVAWSSTQPAIASVSSGGLAIAEQVGSTTILAEGSGLTGSADLTVMPLIAVNYFDRASAEKSGADSTIRLTNPGLTPGGSQTPGRRDRRNQHPAHLGTEPAPASPHTLRHSRGRTLARPLPMDPPTLSFLLTREGPQPRLSRQVPRRSETSPPP